jgi:nitrogen-specific signal transduction histidine kinase
MNEFHKEPDSDALRQLKHDIRNQLSNIHLALEQLKYEMPDPSADCLFYMDTISTSSININKLLISTE